MPVDQESHSGINPCVNQLKQPIGTSGTENHKGKNVMPVKLVGMICFQDKSFRQSIRKATVGQAMVEISKGMVEHIIAPNVPFPYLKVIVGQIVVCQSEIRTATVGHFLMLANQESHKSYAFRQPIRKARVDGDCRNESSGAQRPFEIHPNLS